MNWKTTATAVSVALMATITPALADGELNIYNWGNYTSPDMIKTVSYTHLTLPTTSRV